MGRKKQNDQFQEVHKPKITIHNQQIGICLRTYLFCTSCNKKIEIKAKNAKVFMGKEKNIGGYNNQ